MRTQMFSSAIEILTPLTEYWHDIKIAAPGRRPGIQANEEIDG